MKNGSSGPGKSKGFKPPKDIKKWWSAPHCGPGRSDPSEMCGFCGENVIECAMKHSDYIREHPELNHDGCILGEDDYDDPEETMTCGGSGFWCSGCGRFWAQDSCGEASGEFHMAADGAKLSVDKDRKVYCVCGKHLMTNRPEVNEEAE